MVLFYQSEKVKALICFMFFAGILGIATVFLEPLYLYDIKQKKDSILLAIPIYVFLLAFSIGKPVKPFGLLYPALIGLASMSFSIFFQVFYFSRTSIAQMLFSFICLVCMWGIGRTLSVIIFTPVLD